MSDAGIAIRAVVGEHKLEQMRMRFGYELGAGVRWTRLLLAAAIGVGGAIVDTLIDGISLGAAPQVCAAAIGIPLARRTYLWLIALLACAIVLPAWMRAQTGDFLTGAIDLALLGVVVLFTLRGSAVTVIGDADGTCENHVRAEDESEEPSTWIQAVANDKDQSFQLASDVPMDRAKNAHRGVQFAIDRLRATGSFDDDQIALIEAELHKIVGEHIVSQGDACLLAGDRVGRFVIDKPLSSGGVGNVYQGHDVDSGEPAAIKILHNARVSERFRREMHMVQQLAHPNIVTAYEVGEVQGLQFIAMELLDGPDLNVRVQQDGPLSWLTASKYILQAARALEHAHRRELIHRDIKPGNIILNGADMVKLADLGLAAMATESSDAENQLQYKTQEGHLAGTLAFMAPEQARSLASANVQSDIYGLGATWFYLLTGKPRLRGTSFNQQLQNLLVKRRFNVLPGECMPDSLCKIYHRMTVYQADLRFENCEQLAFALEQSLADVGEPVTTDDIHVLVVEDSHTDMVRTIAILRRMNQSLVIHQAKSLSEGIAVYSRLQIDLVLLDLTLPDSFGVQTVAGFRRVAPDVPVVVLTGRSEQEIPAACIEAGATSFVSKVGLDAHAMERTIFVTLSRFGIAHRV